ncbi:hypothetical protein J6590_078480 [Homalodisca vitripennis]|nr:hypothetical protein J6590_078478 [Homalodisca vitripennis]KAG8320025.1 hypothetical protein J6590_078480 [Homalodisca vitripennis]
MFCKLYDVEGELILINGSGWSAGIIPPHLMLVSNPTPQPLLPLYCPNAVGSASALTFKHVFNLPARLPLGYDPTTTFKETRIKKTLIIRECKDVGVDRCTDASV